MEFLQFRGGKRSGCTLPAGATPSGCNPEVLETQALANRKRTDSIRSDPNLVSGLFFEREFDADLAKLIEVWPQLSKDIRGAILRIGGIL